MMIHTERVSTINTRLSHCNNVIVRLIITTLILIKSSYCLVNDTKSQERSEISQIQQDNDNLLTSLAGRSLSSNLTQGKCSRAKEDLDRCSAQLISFGQGGLPFPTNMDELESIYCSSFRKTVSCIGNATLCFKPFERQIINWILTSTRRMNYKRCKSETEKVKFLRLIDSCLSPMRNSMDKCMRDYIAGLEGIAEHKQRVEDLLEDDIMIQLSCCAHSRFKACIMDNAKHQCKSLDSMKKLKRTSSVSSRRIAQKFVKKSTVDMMEDLRNTLDGMALTGPELFCSGVDEDFCRTKFDGKFHSRTTKHKSIVPALLKIYSNK